MQDYKTFRTYYQEPLTSSYSVTFFYMLLIAFMSSLLIVVMMLSFMESSSPDYSQLIIQNTSERIENVLVKKYQQQVNLEQESERLSKKLIWKQTINNIALNQAFNKIKQQTVDS